LIVLSAALVPMYVRLNGRWFSLCGSPRWKQRDRSSKSTIFQGSL